MGFEHTEKTVRLERDLLGAVSMLTAIVGLNNYGRKLLEYRTAIWDAAQAELRKLSPCGKHSMAEWVGGTEVLSDGSKDGLVGEKHSKPYCRACAGIEAERERCLDAVGINSAAWVLINALGPAPNLDALVREARIDEHLRNCHMEAVWQVDHKDETCHYEKAFCSKEHPCDRLRELMGGDAK